MVYLVTKLFSLGLSFRFQNREKKLVLLVNALFSSAGFLIGIMIEILLKALAAGLLISVSVFVEASNIESHVPRTVLPDSRIRIRVEGKVCFSHARLSFDVELPNNSLFHRVNQHPRQIFIDLVE